ncbi:MAG: hypothetical protein E5X64_35045, partial [Mesorhizobium sp.]
IMDDAEPDVLAYMTFPKEPRAKRHSTDDIDKRDFAFSIPLRFFVRLQVSCSSPRSTGFPVRACRDAVKAGRCDGATAGCKVSRPRLDGVEHGASLERTEASVVPAHSLCYICPGTDDHVAKSGARG